ncbi:MAG: hypothetical protein HFE30_07395 [Clostridiales bacterium]|nr:hypothetical protein [Clostridiales bacterium]
MLAVKPVHDESLCAELCALCNVLHKDGSFMYFAADVDASSIHINHIIGICLFRMKDGKNEIEVLKAAPGISDDDALIIMARTVMNFMYRCEAERVVLLRGGVSENLIDKLGFSEDSDGVLSIDLKKFYISPCKYTEKQ